MGSSSSTRGLDISIASEHCKSSSTSWADLNSPGPAYGCPGSASASPGRHSIPSGRHIYAPADICGPGVNSGTPSAGIYVFRPEYTSLGQIITISAYSGRILQVLGHVAASWLTWAGAAQSRCEPGRLPSGGPAAPSSRPAHPGFPAAVFQLGLFPVSAMGL
jgi:hypothetical protein